MAVGEDDVERQLAPVLRAPTGLSTAGYPYLSRPAWERLRDWIPHLFRGGLATWRALDRFEAKGSEPAETANAVRVVRQVIRTATITAPSDLWLLRHVLSALAASGWRDRLIEGVADVPESLRPDLHLLLARGYLVRAGAGHRWAADPTAARVAQEVGPLPAGRPADLAHRWTAALSGDRSHDDLLLDVLAGDVQTLGVHAAPAWVATPEDIEIGYRLVPLVLGLRAAHRIGGLLESDRLDTLALPHPLDQRALATLFAAGWVDAGVLTPLGRRGLQRGPGPFGIIEAYHPYLADLAAVWARGPGAVHVSRAANVAASQDANRFTFHRANDALDRFCRDTGFHYDVFVEHAVGRGEALRQRYERSGGALTYVGADLEPAAIEAAREEVAAGRLPPDVLFVQADIAEPTRLVAALADLGLESQGAVLVVGNGFHEVRGRTDAQMVGVFRGYAEAGFVVLMTEQSALSVDDLLSTAWNTYHAGFRYVHERSGQGLRPASPAPVPGLGGPLPDSRVECARRAGYRPLEAYGSRSRTTYPYTPAHGHNPAISANLFLVPEETAQRLRPPL